MNPLERADFFCLWNVSKGDESVSFRGSCFTGKIVMCTEEAAYE